jgi:WD40 repeat protein
MRTFALVLLTLCCWTPTFIGEAQRTPDELAEITRENADQIRVLSILEVGGWAMDFNPVSDGVAFAGYYWGSDRGYICVLGKDTAALLNNCIIALGNEEYMAITFSIDGSSVVYGDELGTLYEFNLETADTVLIPSSHEHAILDLEYNANGTVLGIATADVSKLNEPSSVSLLRTNDYSSLCVPMDIEYLASAIAFHSYLPIVAYPQQYNVVLWNYDTCDQVALLDFSLLDSSVTSLAFTSDSKQLVSSSRSSIDIWNVSSAISNVQSHPTHIIHNNTGWPWLTMAISPNDEIITVAGYERVVYLYDLNTGELVTSIESEDIVRDLAFSPDGTKLSATGFDKGVTTEYGIVAPGEGG